MAGFRDGAGAGLDMQVLPQPAVVAVLAVGEARMTVESAYGPRPLRSFIASLSPGPARIRGAGRNAGDVALAGGQVTHGATRAAPPDQEGPPLRMPGAHAPPTSIAMCRP
ncbi:hypothetical protein [Streptomyces sp. MCL20-2]|uniref:hypothetical protein n=1 Tax=Streptomyces sp. MCL20-2 TaxID=2967219 RepID=UPI0029662D45|nr:hypothetical protein [Streptomyces sp. MCL20-2]